MSNKKGRVITFILVIISVLGTSLNLYAHSGRTDSSGGHRDNKNKSGLGYYHYHCGGHPAHLHKNGVCPYSTKTSTKKSSTKKVIKATKIKINQSTEDIYVGETKKLTATISPSNVTSEKITWKSSNKDVTTVNSSGKVTAKKEGKVSITASTSNGKKSTININVIKKKNIKNNNSVETSASVNNVNNNTVAGTENNDTAGGFIGLGLLCGGGYWWYNRKKKK